MFSPVSVCIIVYVVPLSLKHKPCLLPWCCEQLRLSEAETSLREVESRAGQRLNSLEDLRSQVRLKTEEVAQLQQELSSLRRLVDSTDDVEARYSQLLREHTELAKESRQERERLDQALRTLQGELAIAKPRVAELEEQCVQQEEQIKELEEDLRHAEEKHGNALGALLHLNVLLWSLLQPHLLRACLCTPLVRGDPLARF